MQTKNFLQNLIQYVTYEVQDRGAPILRTRLIKLLYICDVEFYRSMKRKLTEIDWFRYKFGPFSFELQGIARSIGFELGEEEVDFETGRGIRYKAEEPHDIDKWLPTYMKVIVDRVIDRWSDEDLDVLLDYVYLETEPMINSMYGEKLDFRKIDPKRRPIEEEEIKIPAEDVNLIREMLDQYGSISRAPTYVQTESDMARALIEIEGKSQPIILEGKVKSSSEEMGASLEGRE
jgi:hypothetical protein